MLQPKYAKQLDSNIKELIANGGSNEDIDKMASDYTSLFSNEALKKKESSTGTAPNKKLDSAPANGSSAGANSKGFPEIDTNSVAPGMGVQASSEQPISKKQPTKKTVAPVKEKKESGFLDYLADNLSVGLNTVSKSLYDAPGLVYDAAASLTNPVFEAMGVEKNKLASADKLASDLGFKNIPSEILQKKIKDTNNKINEYSEKNGGDALAALENGNYSGAAKLVAGTTVQSLPIMIAAMASGGQTMALTAIGVSTASTKNAELKEEHPEMDLSTRVTNSATTGLIEAVTGHLFTGASGAVMKKIIADKGVEAGSKIISKSFTSTVQNAIEKNPFIGALGEVIEETAVEFGNQVTDMASGIRTEFDIHAIKNAGLSATGMGGLNTLGVYGAKGYIKAKDYSKIKSVNKEVFQLRSELSNENMSDENKKLLGIRIDRLVLENKKLLGGELEKLKSLPLETRKELNTLNSDFEAIKYKIEDINDDTSLSSDVRNAMLDELKVRAETSYKRKTEILSSTENLEVKGDFSKFEGVPADFNIENEAVDKLPLKEQETLKKQAMEELVSELNPDGKKDITITNDQVVGRANEILKGSNKNKVNLPLPPSEAPESGLKVEGNLPQKEVLPVEEKSTPDTKEPVAEASPVPSVSENKPKETKIIVHATADSKGFALNYNEGISSEDVSKANDPRSHQDRDIQVELNKGNSVIDKQATNKDGDNEISIIAPMTDFTGRSGGSVYDFTIDKNNNSTAERIKDIIEKNHKFSDKKGNELIKETVGLVKEYISTNEAAPPTNTPADGNPKPGDNPKEIQGKNNDLQPTVKSPTSKGEVGSKLTEINQRVFGLDEEKSKANTVVMEKTIETMAERAGISKEAMFDKIDFEKGDATTTAELSKKGKALFQMAGENANLKVELRDKLKRAQELDANGKSEKEIWIATGWQKGSDGKWRVEFDDSKMQLKEGYDTMRGYPLDEAIEYKELFDLYPDLKKVRFSVIPRLGNMNGAFMPTKNLIMINGELSPAEVRSTLLHEIQHIIQKQEGFATGGTPQMAIDYLNSKISRLTIAKNIPSFVAKAADKLSKSLFSGIDILESKDNFIKEIKRAKNKLSQGQWDVYQSIAGEVEARNVQNRMSMTTEQRKNTPLSETETKILPKEYTDDPDQHEKIGRDEQIVLFQGKQGAMLAEDGKFIVYALTDPNVSTPLHEMAHVYEHYLTGAERTAILENAGHETWSRDTSEHFARGFEKYLADGVAPNPEMKTAFENFKKWMAEIYNGIKASDIAIKLSPEMKTVFDVMLGGKEAGNTNESKTGLVLYHGSPYSFENFDITKLGSGEGAQAFGHGLYFTNTQEIANGYANILSSRKHFWEALQNGNEISLSKEDYDFLSKEIDALGYDGQRAENSDLGNIKVEGEDTYSPEVLEALAVAFGKNAKNDLKDYALSEEEINRFLEIKNKISNPQLYKVGIHEGKTPSEYDYIDWREKLTDKQKEKLNMESSDNLTGEEVYKDLSKKLGTDKKASEYLLTKGIDGISYKSNKGTGGKDGNGRNYVIFDSNSIRIDEINNEKQNKPKSKSDVVKKTVNYKSFGKETEFTVETDSKGKVRIFKKDGSEVPQYTQRKLKKQVDNKDVFKKVKNANYYKILAISEGAQTNNEINVSNKQEIQESINNFIPSNEYEVSLLEVAKGTQFSKDSIEKELGNKDSNWASDQFSKKKTASIERVAEGIVAENEGLNLDEKEVRDALIDIIGTYENRDAVRAELHEQHQKSIDPYYGLNEEDAMAANIEYMTDAEKLLYESVQAEENLSDEEKLNYYQEQYEKSIDALSGEQQAELYEQYESDRQGRVNQNEGNENGNSQESSREEEIEHASTHDRTTALLSERVPHAKIKPVNSPKKLTEIIKTVSNGLKATLIYGRSKRRNTAGTYNPRNTLVRISRAGDIDTVAHELGHLLDDRHDILGTIPSKDQLAILQQLKWYSERGGSNPPAGVSAAKKAEYLEREGLAEFIRSYVANPEQTKIIAPELLAHFENTVDAKTKEVLKQFSTDFLDFANASGIEKTLANVEDIDLPNKSKFIEWVKSFRKSDDKLAFSKMDKFYAEMANSNHFGIKAFKALVGLNGKTDIKSHENFEIMSRVFLGINGKLENIFATGLINAKNEKLKAEGGTFSKNENGRTVYKDGTAMTVKWLIDGLDTTTDSSLKQEMNEVIAMAVAERTIEYAKKFGRTTNLTGIGASIEADLSTAVDTMADFSEMKKNDPAKYDRIQEGVKRYRQMADSTLRYAVDKGRISEEQYAKIKEGNEFYVALNRNMELEPGEDMFSAFNTGTNGIGATKEIIKKAKGGTATIENPYLSLLRNMNNIIKEADRNEVMLSFVEPLKSTRQMGEGEPINFAQIGRLANDGDKNTIKVFVDGKLEKWQFQDDIFNSLKNIESISSNPIMNLLAKPSQLVRWTVTNNPVFYARNIVKDTQARLVVSNNHSTIKDMFHNAGDKELFELFGGSQAGHLHTSKESYSKSMTTAAKEITKKGGVVIDFRKFGEKYAKFLQTGENLNRIAEFNRSYKTGKNQGMSDYDAGLYAAFEARDLMDFAVAGHTMREINKIVVFSNAGVQSLRKARKALLKDPAGFAFRTMLYSVLPTLAFTILRNAMGDDDEYEQLPANQRDMFFNFKTPVTGDAWISIPKPYELGLASAFVDRASSKLRGHDEAFDGVGGTTLKTLMPFDESSFLGGLKPLIETRMNRDTYTGRSIVPEYESGKLLELRKGVTKASFLGQNMSKMFKKAGMSVDPRNIDHIMKGYGTYFATQGMAVTDLMKKDRSEVNFWISKSGFAKDVPTYNAKSVKRTTELAVELGKVNNKKMKSLRAKIEEFYLEDNLVKRKAILKEIYGKSEKTFKKLQEDKVKMLNKAEKEVPDDE